MKPENLKFKTGDDIQLFGVMMRVQDYMEAIINGVEEEISTEIHYVLHTYADSDPTRHTHRIVMPAYWIDNLAEDLT